MSVRSISKLVCPPILWEFMKKMINQMFPPQDQDFIGPYSTWSEAEALSDGWDSPAIVQKTFDLSIKVRDGLVAYGQDTIICNKINYSETILAFILLHLSCHKDKICIVDFGGSLGTNFYQNRKILRALSGTQVTWNIVEIPSIAKLGRDHFASTELFLYSDIDEIIQCREHATDSYLFSGSLQYCPEPFKLLDKVIEQGGAKILAFDRLLVSHTYDHAVFIQTSDPRVFYPASYPTWCFSKSVFVSYLKKKGFDLVEEFTSSPEDYFDHSGMIFIKP
jgi:putative methyltransferase (TIGR04325 family)